MNLRDPQNQRVLLGAMLLAGLGYAFYQYLYTPKRAEVEQLSGDAERLESYNETAKRAAQSDRIAALEEESVGYARRLETFEELIPTTEQVPELLERVATAALESDVDLLAFTPLPAEPGTFYTEQLYEVEVRGGYHEIGSFITRIATLPRIIKPAVTELIGESMAPNARARSADPNAPPPPPETLVHAKLQLSTYVLPGGEAPVAGADTSRPRTQSIQLGAGGAAAPAGAQAPPTPAAGQPPAAPVVGGGLAPGVAPALQAPSAGTADGQSAAPGVVQPGPGGPNVGATPATGAPNVGAAASGEAPAPAALAAPAAPPATAPAGGMQQGAAPVAPPPPPRPAVGELPALGGRDAPAADARRAPGDLPPLGER
ncbi:MAG TPA: type 4a pilus biogenesis protein PilO [Gemmatimonadota bacterium]